MAPNDHDTAERIVRLETKLDFLINQIDKLPPSPACIAKHIEYDARFNIADAWRNRVMGAILIFNIVIVLFMDKLKQVFFHP